MPSLIDIFLSFLKLGATAFGGPSAVAYIHRLAVEKKRWLDEEAFRDGVALCQMIPGATAMQSSAYVGLRTRGIRGALASFTGFGIPSFILMMVLSALYARLHGLPKVVSVFDGLQAIIVAIVANAAVSFGRSSLKSRNSVIIAAVAAAMFGFKLHPIIVVVLSAFLGYVLDSGLLAPRAAAGIAGKLQFPKLFAFLMIVAATAFLVVFPRKLTLYDLAALMVKVDLFAFGGGLASVPLMFHEVVEVRGWMDAQTFMNGIVLGQVTPGPIVITATFVGYMLYGPLGGVVGTLSMFLPSFVVVIGVAPWFDRLRASTHFTRAIGGVLCSFVGLLLTITVRFALNVHWDPPRALVAGAAFIALLLKVDILWVVVVGAIVSGVVL